MADIRVRTFEYDGSTWVYVDDVYEALRGCKVDMPEWAKEEARRRTLTKRINGRLAAEVKVEHTTHNV